MGICGKDCAASTCRIPSRSCIIFPIDFISTIPAVTLLTCAILTKNFPGLHSFTASCIDLWEHNPVSSASRILSFTLPAFSNDTHFTILELCASEVVMIVSDPSSFKIPLPRLSASVALRVNVISEEFFALINFATFSRDSS